MSESSPPSGHRRSARVLIALGALALAIVIGVVVVVVSSGSSSPPVAALPGVSVSRPPLETIFTPGAALKIDPAGTLATLKQIGVDRVRLFFTWNELAPDSGATKEPAGFDASDPAAYPAAGWTTYDTIVRDAAARGIALDVVVGPPPPRWAAGKGAPHPAIHTYWKPSAPDFQQFVEAVGTRYSGHYTPAGAAEPLPRVDFWSVWNEPNLGVQLAPQAIDHSTVEQSALLYRRLAGAAWNGLRASGHAHDTILIGELAPAGATFAGAPGNFAAMAPLRFVRALYCVNSSFQKLTGATAAVRGCPTTPAGSARFAARNPALFHATAFADHPYPQGLPPNQPTPNEPDYAELASLPVLLRTLDAVQRAYGSTKKFGVYDTEFGYQTTPPDTEAGTVSPTLAAKYINWSEYIHWRNPRILSYDQYLMTDPAPQPGQPYTGFATGLRFFSGTAKPTLAAFTMPLYLPVTATAAGHPLEVWGCVRPARYARRSSRRPQTVLIQFKRSSGGSFATVQRVRLTDAYGYFDVKTTFPGSGSVRLSWTDPHDVTIYSRTVAVTVG